MLPEPRWKSLELLIINSCMRERAHTQMDARTPPSPPQISPLPGTGAEALPPTHPHVLHRRPGVPAASRGGPGRLGALSRLPLLGSSGKGIRLYSSSTPSCGGRCPPFFPTRETRERGRKPGSRTGTSSKWQPLPPRHEGLWAPRPKRGLRRMPRCKFDVTWLMKALKIKLVR